MLGRMDTWVAGINGALTPAQVFTGASDSFEAFSEDVIKSGGGRSSPELVDIIVRRSSEVGPAVQGEAHVCLWYVGE